ncbi:MAG: hypothetical protein SGJ24_10825 [Chloroflexota bacterium]|nr:hypothetical protein [Chloroflexota bacterium]
MEIWQQTLVIGLGLGLILAALIVPRSLKEEPVYGGALAQGLHALGALCFASVIPTTIVALILRGGFGTAFPLAVSLVVLAYLILLVFAAIEQPARARLAPRDDVWTAEKAKTSGL